ncbi:MAG: tRNA-binding protein, partial [Flavobacteriaceae bacterium CG17_big_fil_post_rev_8_21_14_2_50_33_15]
KRNIRSTRFRGKEISEVLVLGVPDNRGNCVLLQPDRIVPTGARVY